ncbi:SH3 domain-containing protein [Streptomyces sp. NPDC056178]|uniref:SH3 domain-containing protein n=1 Tax=unclassified Streptomyces TaxID=2593676 RepID=UPI0035D6BCB8
MPVVITPTAMAAPSTASALVTCTAPYGPWEVHTSAANIRSKPSTNSVIRGVLYKSHKFTVHKKSGNWVSITDRTTGVSGWVSGTYVYRSVHMCLD